MRFAQFGVNKCPFLLPRRRGDKDAPCAVTVEAFLATKLTSGCCPRAGGLGHRQESKDAVGALCALCGFA